MADRTSAQIFGDIFAKLAEDPDERNRELAAWLWKLQQRHDFSPCQMPCSTEDLQKLGLASVEYTAPLMFGGERIVKYKGEEGGP